jgi:hypothetical protein
MSHKSRLMSFHSLSYNLSVVELTLTNVVIADCI